MLVPFGSTFCWPRPLETYKRRVFFRQPLALLGLVPSHSDLFSRSLLRTGIDTGKNEPDLRLCSAHLGVFGQAAAWCQSTGRGEAAWAPCELTKHGEQWGGTGDNQGMC